MREQAERIKVCIADAHVFFRQGLRQALSQEPDIEVPQECGDGNEAFRQIEAGNTDVAILDSRLPSLNGLELTRKIRLHFPKVSVIVLSAYEDEEQLFEAIKVGAAAYFTKDVTPSDLVTGIRRIYQGEYLINESLLTRPKVASRVLKQFQDLSLIGKEVEPLLAPLSGREIEILDYIARGNSNKEIARALGISDQTVKNHITSILRKLAANDRTHAVVLALRHGWIKMA